MINEKEYVLSFFLNNSFRRKKCKKCGAYFWTLDSDRELCGEAPCEPYTFLRTSIFNRRLDLNDMRSAFLKFFEERGHAILKPYPVVARWRDDLYLTIASIALFQPFVTNGIAPPPANPLVVSQPCIRLVDIDNVGITMGRHLTIFEMGGHHAFNYPEHKKYWKEETVEYCHEFLTNVLGASPEDITYKESFWEGGGNAGPCFEVCLGGLEVATLVFMCYKVINGQYLSMPLKIVDTGYGMERLTWISQQTPTAFHAVFSDVMDVVLQNSGITLPGDDLLVNYVFHMSTQHDLSDDARRKLAKMLNINVEQLKGFISPLENVFAILDHTKCLAFMLADGIVPSNVGEGYLARLVLRRTLRLMSSLNLNLSLSDIIALQIDFWGKYFPRLREMKDIILDIVAVEEEKYSKVLAKGSNIVKRICSKIVQKGSRELPQDVLIDLYDSHGIPPELVSKIASNFGVKVNVPSNFYAIVADKHQKKVEKAEEQAISVHDVEQHQPTKQLFYENQYLFDFKARVVGLIKNHVILDKTAFYPEGGGQPSDTGVLKWRNKEAKVVDVQKVGNVILHRLEGELPSIGEVVRGIVDVNRRLALMRSHTATHLILAAAMKVLGKHVWQAGAQKGVQYSRLDVTHYKSIGRDALRKIELLANKYVMANLPIKTYFMDRTEAEQKFGFRLYQGGVVPGRKIRIVEIDGIDVQACGGTHCRRTGEVGFIKIVRASKIQDGVVRIEFACGESAVEYVQKQEGMIFSIANALNTPVERVPEAVRKLKDELKNLKRRAKRLWKALASTIARELASKEIAVGNLSIIVERFEGRSIEELLDLASILIKEKPERIVFLLNIGGEAVTFIVSAGKVAVEAGFNAGKISRDLAVAMEGKGGGKIDLGQGQGRALNKIDAAQELLIKYVKSLVAAQRS